MLMSMRKNRITFIGIVYDPGMTNHHMCLLKRGQYFSLDCLVSHDWNFSSIIFRINTRFSSFYIFYSFERIIS